MRPPFLAGAVFVFLPRLGSPLWGAPTDDKSVRSGLGDEMDPTSLQELLVDDSAAFRVSFDGPVPERAQRYWRGPVLTRDLRLAHRPDRGVRLDVEQLAVGDAHEQDRGPPFDVVLVGVDRLARLGHGGVDREAIRQRRVELTAEHDRRPVRDLELHPDDGRDLEFDQARRDARERILE